MTRSSSRSGAQPQVFRLSPFALALRGLTLASIFGASATLAQPASTALPVPSANGVNGVVSGSATITGPGMGNTLTVSQTSNFAQIDWTSFDVGSSRIVDFDASGAAGNGNQAVTLNNVIGGSMSQIYGQITGNGTVVLINPAGVMIGPGGVINVGSLVASSLVLDPDRIDETTGALLAAGGAAINVNGAIEIPLVLGTTSARVVNQGGITAVGDVTLIGRGVTNSTFDNGVDPVIPAEITAGSERTVRLQSADGALLTFAAPVDSSLRDAPTISGVVGIAALPDPDAALLNSAGSTITANGGTIELLAEAAPGLLLNLVNNSGALVATGVSNGAGGTVQLIGTNGNVVAGGTIDAAGDSPNGDDGSITATATGGTLAVGSLNTGANASIGTINLTAGQGITTDSGTVTTDELTANGGAGAVTLSVADGVELTNISNTSGLVSITGAGNLAVVSVSGPSVTLTTATGNITGGDGVGPVNVTSTGLLTATAGGSTGINLDTSVASLDASTTAANADITITEIDSISAPDGILLTAVDTVADGDITVTALTGNILAGAVAAGGNGDVDLIATTVAGQQILDDDDAATRVNGDVITLNAESGIGVTDGTASAVGTAASGELVATVDDDGPINIDQSGALAANELTLTLADGDVFFTIDTAFDSADLGTDALAAVVGNDLSITTLGATSNLNVGDLEAATITLNSGSTLDSNMNTVVTATGNLTATASGDIDLDTAIASLNATSSGGSVTIRDLGALAVGVVSGSTVNLTAGTNITDGNDSGTNNVTSTGLFTVTATNGSINLDTAVPSLDATAGNGALIIRNTGDLALTDVDTAAGSIGIDSSSSITVLDVAAIGGNVTLEAGGDLLGGALFGVTEVSTSGKLTATSDGSTGIMLDTSVGELDASTTAAGADINITEANGISLTAVDTASGGDIAVTALLGNITAGAVDATSTGNVTLTANVLANQKILDDEAGLLSATRITGNTVTLVAGGGIGTTGVSAADVDTAANSLDARVQVGILSSVGDVNIDEADTVILTNLVPSNGDLSFTIGAALTGATFDVGSNDLSLTTVGGGPSGFDLSVGALNAANITLSSSGTLSGGTATASSNLAATANGNINLSTDVASLDATSTNGTVTISDTGALAVGVVSGSTVNLIAGTNITDGNGNVTNNVSSAGLFTVTATAGLINLDTAVASLDASAGSGALTIRNTGSDLTLTAVDTANGAITVNSSGNIAVTNVVATGGNVTLGAGGNLLGNAANGVTEVSTAGTFTANSGGSSGIDLDTSVGTLDASATGSGGISIRESDGVILSDLDTAGGNISVTANAGNITAADINATTDGDVTLIANTVSGQAITDDATATRIVGDVVTLTANAGVGTLADSLETSAGSLTVAATTSGDINIDEFNAVTLTSVAATSGDVRVVSASGDVGVGVVSGNNITLGASGALNDGNTNALNISSPGGLLTATAGSGISLDTNVATLTASGGSGAVTIRESNGLAVRAVSASGGSTITLNAGGAITDDLLGTNVTTTGLFDVTAVGGIGLDTAVGTLKADGGSGAVTIAEAGDVQVGSIAGSNVTLSATGAITDDAQSSTRITGNLVTLTAGMGLGSAAQDLDLTAGSLAAITTSGPININELDSVTVNALSSGAGDIALSSGGALTLPAGVSGSNLSFTTRDVGATLTVNGFSTSGSATLSSGGAIGTSGTGTVAANALIATAASGIDLDTDIATLSANGGSGAVTIRDAGSFVANGVSGSAVTLTAIGAINGGAGGPDVTTAGLLTTTAGSGIALDTQVGSLDASVTGVGNLAISEADGLNVLSADTANGNVLIGTTTGNIVAGTIAAGTAGNVTLTATGTGGQILDDGGDLTPTTTRVAGNLVTLTADAGIGTEVEDIDTDAVTIAANTNSGPINIDELNGATVSASTASDDIVLGTATGNLSVMDVSTAGGVGLNAGGSIVGVGTGTDVSAGSLIATAGSGIDLDTDVQNLDANVTGPGNIAIDEANGLAVGAIQTGGSLILSTGGALSPGSIQANGVTVTTVGELLITNDQQIDGGNGAVVITTSGGGISQERGRESPAILGSSIVLNSGGNVGLLTVPLEVDTNGSTIVNFSDASSQGFISGSFGSLNESGRVLGLASNSELSGVVGAIQSSFEKRVSFNLDSSQFSSSARIFATEGTAVQLPEDQRE